jgi:hypothetical protein
MEMFRGERHMLQARARLQQLFSALVRALTDPHVQHILKFLDRESVDLFHGDTYKASEVV